MLNFIYGRPLVVNRDNVASLTSVADYLQVLPLLQKLAGYIYSALDIENCLEFYWLVDSYNLQSHFKECQIRYSNKHGDLKKYILHMITSVFIASLIRSDETDICLLPIEAMRMYLLKKSRGQKKQEIDIYRETCAWLKFDSCREEYTDELMKLVQFSLMTNDQLTEILQEQTNLQTIEAITHALKAISPDIPQVDLSP